jgi:heptosyltransferase II
VKILIIQTAFIGDAILATALAEKLHRFYPKANIDFVLRKGNESLLQEHPFIRKIHIWDKKQGKYPNLWRILKAIRQEQYDQVINCQRFAASGLLTVFSGAKQTVGFDKNPLSLLFSKRIKHQIGAGQSRFGLQYIHEIDRNLALIDHLTDTSPERPKLYPRPQDTKKALALANNQSYTCIAPTSVWFTKQWPASHWIALIKTLPANQTVFLLGAPSDWDACDHIAQAAQRTNIVNLAGKISLITSAALIQKAEMNYVNDSAPLHLASAMNAPVTAIFCSTVPEFGFTPLSGHHEIWQNDQNLPCRPCGLHGYKACPKGHFACAAVKKG